jgi:hypothetical protein
LIPHAISGRRLVPGGLPDIEHSAYLELPAANLRASADSKAGTTSRVPAVATTLAGTARAPSSDVASRDPGKAFLVQTFLPYPDFAASAAVLDDRRLGKQRVEALQVLRAVTREAYGWKHHPVVRMWMGYPEAVAAYGLAICDEWVRRGCADTCAATIRTDLAEAGLPPPRNQAELVRVCNVPAWLGDSRLHRSHQAALVRKDPEYYQPLFPDADRELPYFWPSRAD